MSSVKTAKPRNLATWLSNRKSESQVEFFGKHLQSGVRGINTVDNNEVPEGGSPDLENPTKSQLGPHWG